MSVRILEVKDMAEALHVSEPTVHRLVAAGKLTSFKIGRRRLFPEYAIDQYVEENVEGPWRDAAEARIPSISAASTADGSRRQP
jgi:excisionase family DNA binding protein